MNQYRTVSAAAPVVPIAPSPLVVAPQGAAPSTVGQKRKLHSSNSIHATAVAAAVAASSATASNTNPTGMIPRRESAPASLTPLGGRSQIVTTTTKPSDYWRSLLEEWTVPILDTVGIEQDDHDHDNGNSNSNNTKNPIFLETTSDRVEAYQNIELLTAVRRRDLATLRRIAAEQRSEGSTMDACNRFGESILHLACRKGSLDVVELLLDECGCSLLVRDDYGRTVLHDACWTVHPQWELIKLILKKAPVLWRVSDVRGHLALQYVPKSAWPQWSAFLSKNRDLLKRIMVHSYHQIDICKPSPPPPPQVVEQQLSQTQQQQLQLQSHHQAQDKYSCTNDGSDAHRRSLPQHQQPRTHLPMPIPTPASLPVSTHNSAEQLPPTHPGPSTSAQQQQQQQQRLPAFGLGGTSALQARDVLARALAQAHPAMVQAIQQNQEQVQPRQQGLMRYPQKQHSKQHSQPPPKPNKPVVTSAATAPASAAITTTTTPATPPKTPAQTISASVPGPATAALDEALRAQSSPLATRSKAPGLFSAADDQNSSQQQLAAQPPKSGDGAQTPLPYAPSISVINERLTGYQKTKQIIMNNKNSNINSNCNSTNNNNTSESTDTSQSEPVKPTPNQEFSSSESSTTNPLPAVPNPLLAAASENQDQQQQRGVFSSIQASQGQQKDIPSSITTRNNHSSDSSVPNPMAASSGDATNCNSNNNNNSNNGVCDSNNENSISSVTMSASMTNLEESVSESPTPSTTDTDSDRAVSSNKNNNTDGTPMDVDETGETPDPKLDSEEVKTDEDNCNKIAEDVSKKRVIG